MDSPRSRLLALAESLVGSPYLWPCEANRWAWGKGQRLPDGRRTFDCSGLVTVTAGELFPHLKARFPPAFTNAAKLHAQLPETSVPDAGAEAVVLAFYGLKRVWHVELVYPDGRCIGASGGDSACTDVATAQALGAGVKVKPKYQYRRDFRSLGVLRLSP